VDNFVNVKTFTSADFVIVNTFTKSESFPQIQANLWKTIIHKLHEICGKLSGRNAHIGMFPPIGFVHVPLSEEIEMATYYCGSTAITLDPETTTIKDILEMRLPELGQGVSRTAFALNESFVVKVAGGSAYGAEGGFAGGNENEVEVWQDLTEEEKATGTFAAIAEWANDFGWLVMERAQDVGYYSFNDEQRALIREKGIGDLHEYNKGVRHDGTTMAIDYAYPSGGMGGWGDDYCECGECDCGECWPNGCECEEMEGCKAVECDRCISIGADARRMMADTRIPIAAHHHLMHVVRRGPKMAQHLHSLPHIDRYLCDSHAIDAGLSVYPLMAQNHLWHDMGIPVRDFGDMMWNQNLSMRFLVRGMHVGETVCGIFHMVGIMRHPMGRPGRIIMRDMRGNLFHFRAALVSVIAPCPM
jgi:hypothetical protein